MNAVWIASMVLQWVVIAVLCLLVLSLVRQIGALNLRLNAVRDREADEGPALHSRLPAHEITLADAATYSAGGVRERPSLIVFFSPSCGACEALPDAIATLVREVGTSAVNGRAANGSASNESAANGSVANDSAPSNSAPYNSPDDSAANASAANRSAVNGQGVDVLAVISGDRESAARLAAEKSLSHVAVAGSADFPEYYVPRHGVPFAIALTADGIVAARGKPKTLEHLREMAHAARNMAELATQHATRDHEWGQSAPYW